jgi:peptidoglycan hydrolase-like protein with peptidoglycan-binding domain
LSTSFISSARRKSAALLVGIVAAVGLTVTTSSVAEAAVSTSQAQWNLAGLGYLPYSGVDGIAGPATANAASVFQTDRCLDVDGIIGNNTSNELVSMMKKVQAKVGATQDGLNGPNTKSKIISYQQANGLVADGMAGPATMTKMGIARTASCGTGGSGTGIIGDIYQPSNNIACPSGTTNLGTAQKAYSQGASISTRLCAIPGFKSTSSESTPGNTWYVSGANGNVIVTSRVAGAVLGMYNKAKSQGLTVSATSSFRTMAHQQALCNGNTGCRTGTSYAVVAKPGTSLHQLGVAIDFAGPSVKKLDATCANRATDTSSATYNWLKSNAAAYGYKQYAVESWHWDPLVSGNRC